MSYEIIDFRNIVVKPYLKNETRKNVTNEKKIDRENEISVNANPEKNFQINANSEKNFQFQVEKTFLPNSSSTRNRDRSRKLPLKYKNDETDISIFSQNDSQNDQLLQSALFVKSRRKEINDLFEKNCFEIVSTANLFREIRIFNSRFVDEIKNIDIANAYEKSRLMMQAYNDEEKIEMLTQTFTIQRMNQRFILTLTTSMSHLNLFFRDIFQIYVQSNISLAKIFFIRSSVELGFGDDVILKIIKSLYEVPEIEIH